MKKTISILIIASLLLSSCSAQEYTVTFKVDMTNENNVKELGLMGNVSPLSFKNKYLLTDENNDGIYEATITFNTSKKNLRFKYVKNDDQELYGSDNRILWFKKEPQSVTHVFNQFNTHSEEILKKLVYTEAQIKEDVAMLRTTIQFIHPSLYKYRDSVDLEKDFELLEREMLEEPTLVNAFKAVSKFAANIKCSHTFTNPWNQGQNVKKAIFHTTDKLPFTFDRIDKKMFIAKNASNNEQLVPGREILSINGISVEEIFNKLAKYITSDGNNYEKRLQRLTMSGKAKFELFDIFFPLEFGSNDTFQLKLKNLKTQEEIETSVFAMSKTQRTRILKERYTNFDSSLKEGWKFEMIDSSTGHLKIESFSVFNSDFKWKNFLDNAFKTLKNKKAENLIIDIRDNEGGDTQVVEYILERIIDSPITVELPLQTTAYRKIPEKLKKHISTWDKRPYNWGNKVTELPNGNYKLKDIYVESSQTYKPKKDGFNGSVYVLTNAENSSATHIMATYIKKYKLATIVGQETGGNQQGLNAGYIFFHRLPNSKIELDIPVFHISMLEQSKLYDGGIIPDILVEKNINDFINGIDTELERVKEIIKNKK